MKKCQIILLVTVMVISLHGIAQLPYKNRNLSPELRARDLLSRMTLDEKVMQTQCLWSQKSGILNAAGDFDETKAASVLKKWAGRNCTPE